MIYCLSQSLTYTRSTGSASCCNGRIPHLYISPWHSLPREGKCIQYYWHELSIHDGMLKQCIYKKLSTQLEDQKRQDSIKKHRSEHFITISTDHTELLSTFNATHPVDWHRDVCMYFGGGDREGCVLDSCQLVPKAGRHKVLHLVCKKAQRCKKGAEELWKKSKREKKKN